LHTSDLHLDSLEDDACEYLEAVVAVAIDRRVDLVIIAGDLFDRSRVGDGLARFVVEQLRRLPMPAVVLPGNHDCLAPGSVYQRVEFQDRGGNIALLRNPQGETITLPGLGISLWGKSINSHDDVRPLAGMPPAEQNGRWNIAVGHGYFVGGEYPLFPSYHITREEIAGSGWDYVALGHVPVFRCVCREPLAYYSGSPPLSGAVVMVTLDDETGVQVSRCPL
jgi:DNA repair exonuclease SbcCD nuclease subunit